MKRIILFDGVCNFCQSSVQFIINRDSNASFYFASLQSEFAQSLCQKYNIDDPFNSMILIDGENVYNKSTAALQICRRLDGIWKYLYFFIVIPAQFRNFLYDLIAKNRYKWFGKKQQCMIPSPEVRKRFLS